VQASCLHTSVVTHFAGSCCQANTATGRLWVRRSDAAFPVFCGSAAFRAVRLRLTVALLCNSRLCLRVVRRRSLKRRTSLSVRHSLTARKAAKPQRLNQG
jgi:hypothetical protein